MDANEAMQPMAILAALEREKARLARDLHDELAQSLFAARCDLAWLRDNAADAPDDWRAKLQHVQQLVDEVADAARHIASGLRPPVLQEAGFVPALRWLARDFADRTGVSCDLNVRATAEVGEPHASAAFRIVQEALRNVEKHARASHVDVDVLVDAAWVKLAVRDDGRGFSPRRARRADAMGLLGQRERARLLHGDMKFVSAPGAGTRVFARIPLPPATLDAKRGKSPAHGVTEHRGHATGRYKGNIVFSNRPRTEPGVTHSM